MFVCPGGACVRTVVAAVGGLKTGATVNRPRRRPRARPRIRQKIEDEHDDEDENRHCFGAVLRLVCDTVALRAKMRIARKTSAR